MKKILVISSWYPNIDNPGLGTFFRDQATLFEDEFDIRIFAGHMSPYVSRSKKLKNTIRFALFRKVSIQKMNDYYLSPPYVYGFRFMPGLNKCKKANFRLIISTFLNYFERNILPDWKPDLIHAQNTNMAGIIARYISEKFQIPYIVTDHHPFSPRLSHHIAAEIKLALINSKKNCFVSEWQYRTYLLFNSSIRGQIIGNPVDSNIFKTRSLKGKKFVISHVSNADKPKDIGALMQTIKLFFEKVNTDDEFEFNLVGFSEDIISNLRRRVEKYKWNKQLKFYEPQSKQFIIDILQNSNVFLFTSIYESFGIAPVEAMMCGVPVVSTNNGGINEYMINGVNGIKCPIKDSEALSDALIDIYKDKRKFDPKDVRASVVNKFSQKVFKDRMLKIYQEN